jgi:hypothetical protein
MQDEILCWRLSHWLERTNVFEADEEASCVDACGVRIK